nr:metallophosphoesterase family protein [Paenibacillus stellifer]
MKTFAVITDIHGNSPALRAVLEDISNKEIDHIFCLGDMVGIGPDSNQVLEMLTEQKNEGTNFWERSFFLIYY